MRSEKERNTGIGKRKRGSTSLDTQVRAGISLGLILYAQPTQGLNSARWANRATTETLIPVEYSPECVASCCFSSPEFQRKRFNTTEQ